MGATHHLGLPAVTHWWRAVHFLVARSMLAVPAALLLALGAAAHSAPLAVTVCVVAFAGYLAVSLALSDRARRSVRLLRHDPIPSPWPRAGAETPSAFRARLISSDTRREAGFALVELLLAPVELAAFVGWVFGSPLLIAAPLLARGNGFDFGPVHVASAGRAWVLMGLGFVVLAGGVRVLVALTDWHAVMAERLLGPRGEQLRRHLAEVRRSRLRLADAFEVERRRIERDLHDGAQQQLVALAMKLDLVRIELEDSSNQQARQLLAEAHTQATEAISGLRELIWGIQPPVLIDRGLSGALEQLAAAASLPVELRLDLPRRLPAAIESTAYFVVSEALTNAAKHSHATRVHIDARLRGERLELTVSDDGIGGAEPSGGSGLTGLADRVTAFGGELTISSPPGGPTRIQIYLDSDHDTDA